MSETTPTPYERVGGEEAIKGLVAKFYGRVLNEPSLAPFFEGADLDKLSRMQQEFFTAALGGPVQYSGMDLSYAHQGRGIKRKHFATFAQLMLDTLQEFQFSEDDTNKVIDRINMYIDEIVGGSAGIGG